MHTSLIASLNDLGRKVNEQFPLVNCGGCAVFAALVGWRLRLLPVDPKIVVAKEPHKCDTLSWVNIDEVRSKINDRSSLLEWDRNGVKMSHVGVDFAIGGDRYLYDSYGVTPKNSGRFGENQFWEAHDGRLMIGEIAALARQEVGWNPQFDRTQIPQLRQVVDDHFRDAGLYV